MCTHFFNSRCGRVIGSNPCGRQIIMNNYGRDGTTWGIEVTTSNTLRY